jgi:hypothetical protein
MKCPENLILKNSSWNSPARPGLHNFRHRKNSSLYPALGAKPSLSATME